MPPPGVVVLLRHGETAWSRDRRHTGRTDVPLTDTGEAQARDAARLLAGRSFAAVRTSPLVRASRTAELAGFPDARPDPDLQEWDYGAYDGVTTDEIHQRRPGWVLWEDGCPDGEQPADVGRRADRVLAAVRPVLDRGDVLLVAHGHLLRVLAARWVGLPAAAGRLLRLDTATVSRLGHEHDDPVVLGWNCGGTP